MARHHTTSYNDSRDFQLQLDSPIPLNAVDNSLEIKAGAQSLHEWSDTLQSLLFSAPTTSGNSCDSAVELDWGNNESATGVAAPFFLEDSSLEPCPIDENKIEVLSKSSTSDERSIELWRMKQQQQMKSLINMVFYREVATSGNLPPGNTENTQKRCLDLPLNQDDTFRPIKKQRSSSPAVDNSDVSSEGDSLNQFGRFRDYQSGQWSLRFRELQQFRKRTGHCCVPHGYPENPVLARWVKRQRYQYKLRAEGKSSTMTIERIQALESLGFVWDSHGEAWMERYLELREYFMKHGSCNVSSCYISSRGRQLSSWIKCQRRQYRMFQEGSTCTMNTERISMLESIGFEWDLRLVRTASPSSSPRVVENC